MRQLLKSFSWYLYGGVSCYCLQRFLVDFLYIPNDENELFRSGDIVVLDVWNRLELERYSWMKIIVLIEYELSLV